MANFIDWIASRPARREDGLNRFILIRDARAVQQHGGRREFEERLAEAGGPFAETISELRAEWKSEGGQ